MRDVHAQLLDNESIYINSLDESQPDASEATFEIEESFVEYETCDSPKIVLNITKTSCSRRAHFKQHASKSKSDEIFEYTILEAGKV